MQQKVRNKSNKITLQQLAKVGDTLTPNMMILFQDASQK